MRRRDALIRIGRRTLEFCAQKRPLATDAQYVFALLFFGIIAFVKGIIPVREYIEGRMNVSDEDIEEGWSVLADLVMRLAAGREVTV